MGVTGFQLDGMRAARGVAHGFFARTGGVSQGLYEGLNCGLGSNDDRAAVLENRRRAAERLGVAGDNLVTLYQVHSPDVVTVTEPWAPGDGPKADGMVTRTKGFALGVLAADCTPILFADGEAGIIGACHAGWKGALAGVADATVAAMEALGASRQRIIAAIGPTIRQICYEVGAEFRDRFVADAPGNAEWFRPGRAAGKFHFDLPGYLTRRLEKTGIAGIEDCEICTYSDSRFFSYRRTTHRGESDYGRNLSAIVLTP
ncbi:MAG: peptidoglycan editing factor PgeF [Alphaproteobacteria bacterium]|nr:peptidoglycan editing factor PgeF [Alphaproteobacteria bacterium]